MELYQELLVNILKDGRMTVSFPDFDIDPAELTKQRCYKSLNDICAIIRDNEFSDEECFIKIERIVSLFEENGIRCGGRHDFG